MSVIERYRKFYAWEIDSDQKMLAMIDTLPVEARTDPRFQRAVTIAGHLAACRENWLDRMTGIGSGESAWFDSKCDVSMLKSRFAAVQARWTDYLAQLNDDSLAKDFKFMEGESGPWSEPVEMQVAQLAFHANYHRGQVVLLVDQLGGETVDTDYVDWAFSN